MVPAGALEPKWSMPTALPLLPTYLCYPSVASASTLTLAVTTPGRTLSLYSSVCSSNSSQLTSDTTRTFFPPSSAPPLPWWRSPAPSREHGGPLPVEDGHFVGAGSLGAVRRAEHQDVGHRPEAHQMLDRLVRRSVLPSPMESWGGDPHGRAHVVGEDKERGAVGDEPRAVEADTIANGAHPVLPHPEPDVPLLRRCHVGGREVGAAAEEPWQHLRQGDETLLRQVPRRIANALGVPQKETEEIPVPKDYSSSPGGPSPIHGATPADYPLQGLRLLLVLVLVLRELGVPLGLQGGAFGDMTAPVVPLDVLGHVEGLVGPPKILPGRVNFLRSESASMDGVGVGLVRADLVVASVAVLDPDGVPAEGLEAGADVLGEGNLRVAVNRDGLARDREREKAREGGREGRRRERERERESTCNGLRFHRRAC
ncbi:unnamed protein product [Spirodela intermedia]|uniref:Uncharacterized protein n=2 Tax=Spirodela intermedia TaxID=51605 RepID=A0A7I8KPY5_SPIIN|nr:unnamed protein product [Spirodela intermedia]CAA6663398.1 unnamed protein product [Spirodela intermedia]CAA7399860.1 unnamed protein product [Spirodela intermedia]